MGLTLRGILRGGLLAGLALGPELHASGLVWEKQTIEVNVDPDAQEVKAAFEFRNGASHPIAIESVDTGCGCTEASVAKKTYGPGESGRVDVAFLTEGRIGLQEETVAVVTDEPGADPVELRWRVNLQSYLRFDPEVAQLHFGKGAAEKTVLCTAATPRAVLLTTVSSSSPGFTVRLETLEPGRKYLLHLSAASLDRPQGVVLEIGGTVAGVGARSFEADAAVR